MSLCALSSFPCARSPLIGIGSASSCFFHQANDQESRRSPLRVRHPRELGKAEVEAFLTHLAVARNVAVLTQYQALNALVFLYRQVLHQPFDHLERFHARCAGPKYRWS